MRVTKIKWFKSPEEKDYPAAFSYLSLLFSEAMVTDMVEKLRKAPVSTFHSKDIFRASGLALLGPSNFHVKRDKLKIKEADRLSPLLLVRHPKTGKVVIADGYHRLCAVYSVNEDEVIPCKII